MRKSSRTKKPVDFYIPRTVIHKDRIPEEEEDDVEEDEEDDNNLEIRDKEEEESSSSDEKEQKSSNLKKPKNISAQKTGLKGKFSSNNHLFEGFLHRKGASAAVDKWVASYRTNKVAAMADLLNFLLMIAGGGPKRWVQTTIDIDGLTSEEFEELLSEPISFIREQKPHFFIYGASQKSNAARENYVNLWDTLTTKLLTLPNRVKILSIITETFLSLSISSVPSIRDAVTEASLTFGNVLLRATVDLRVKDSESQRQLSASSRGTGAKKKAILSMSKETQTALRELDEMITAIFTTVFVSRSKDVIDNIRLRALIHLGEWMITDPERWITDDYLKYLGWLASDRSSPVRLASLEIVIKLLEKSDFVPRLIAFCERFIPRFIEIAVGDVDDSISLVGVKLMRKFQKSGLLDHIDQSSLDLVDRIVFDSSATSSVRAEALAFMMDHTEGFDDDGAEDDTANSSKKKKKSSSQRSSQENTEMKILARRKKTSIQLETLAEFADHHLKISGGGNLEYINLLAEACNTIRPAILRDWNTMFALLLRDTDSRLMLTELDPVQVSIIFRLCSQSASFIKQEYLLDNESDTKKDSLETDWRNLQDALEDSLIPLITRYRSEDDHLEIVLDLLECCDITLIEGKALQSLVKTCTELFETLQSETSLSKMGKVIRFWMSSQSKRKVVVSSLKPLLEHSWKKILETVHRLPSSNEESNAKKGRGARRSQGGELLHEMIPATRKFVAMWRCIDCRSLLNESVEGISTSIAEANQILVQSIRRKDQDQGLVEIIAENLGHTLFNILLWETRDVYMHTMNLKNESESENISNSEIDGHIGNTLALRTTLLEILDSWMDLNGTDATESRHLQCEAFRMVGDVRKLFPLKEVNYFVVDQLAWHPSEELFSKLGKVFSAEETRIRERLDELGESEKDQLEAQQLSRQLVEKLLWPISGQMYDMENFHRRQAAAALNYIIDPNEDIQKMIRAWIKSMKDSNFGKYLEAIIVALKHAYEDNIGGVLEKLISSHQEEIELEENESDLVETLAENLEYTMQIATKLSQTLGVGKLKSPLKELLVLFFQVGLKHAFSEVKSLGFLRLLEVFMKLLPDSSLLEVGKYYESCLDNVSDEMKTFLGGHINIGGDAEEFLNDSLKRFTSHLTNIVSGPPLKYLYNLPVGGGKAKRPSTAVESKKKKSIKAPPVVKSSSSIVSSRPKRKNREQKSYQELSGTESEEEEEEEEDIQPSPKRTKILARQSRPSNISTISELTQDSFHIPDEIEQDTNENDQYNTPVKKRSRHTLSISSPIHQIGEINEEVVDEEEEGLDDNHHWGKPTREVEELKHSDPVLGLHLEDFGTDLDYSDYAQKELEEKKFDEEYNALPSRRRR